ncbi:hypothetical protein CGRA01v4_03278 [Colletotrichum graminicola]|nr:hypothetical protein CGRA01v4_03278 [Colletotrichum graminicola]
MDVAPEFLTHVAWWEITDCLVGVSRPFSPYCGFYSLTLFDTGISEPAKCAKNPRNDQTEIHVLYPYQDTSH